MAVKGDKSLRALAAGIVAADITANLPDITLKGGDADGSNNIDIGDFGILVNAYSSDSTITGSGYYDRPDFNYDGVVDIDDFSILINEYSSNGVL